MKGGIDNNFFRVFTFGSWFIFNFSHFLTQKSNKSFYISSEKMIWLKGVIYWAICLFNKSTEN